MGSCCRAALPLPVESLTVPAAWSQGSAALNFWAWWSMTRTTRRLRLSRAEHFQRFTSASHLPSRFDNKMADRLCRPCRDLARRQLRAMIELNHAPHLGPGAIALVARNPRRQLHQTTVQRRGDKSKAGEPSNFAKVLTGIASAVLPRQATQPYAIFGATETIYKACSAPAAYTISEELRKKEEVPMTKDGEEIGVGGGVWHEGISPQPHEFWTGAQRIKLLTLPS